MAGINIPGVNDKYKTNDLVEGLMKVERVPLTREQDTLESYKTQQNAWRDINQKMSSLRDSVKTLYSYDNPFNNKLASSSDEFAITADATRDASYSSFKIDVISPATADRILSKEIEKGETVPEGTYTFKVGEKNISFKWRGGKVEDFINSLNKRGADVIKASLIGVNKGKNALLIESLKTGAENRLVFEDDALKFALEKEMVRKVASKSSTFGTRNSEFSSLADSDENSQDGMPALSANAVRASSNKIVVSPRGGAQIEIPSNVKGNQNSRIEFTLNAKQVDDITNAINEGISAEPDIPDAGGITFGDVVVKNEKSQTGTNSATAPQIPRKPLDAIRNDSVLYAILDDGTEKEIPLDPSVWNFDGEEKKVSIDAKDFPGITAIAIKNRNTGVELSLGEMTAFDAKKDLGFEPIHAVSEAGDAVLKYEGITITRPENKIDDIVPGVTLHVNQKTDRTATITIEPDIESAKNALINFVGKYNQIVAEMNVLSQNKPEIINELDYLSADERADYEKKLGLFFNDFTISSAKGSMQQILSSQYKFSDNAAITMLSQIGISTNATNFSGYNPGKMRGYLEIDEKKLDENLRDNLEDIRRIFGYDTDGDLIIDDGIGFLIDKQLTSYVQTGGILASKTSVLDRQIDATQKKIARLETQLDKKEADLRNKYGQMEGTLNSLESQQDSITNFTRQQQNNRN